MSWNDVAIERFWTHPAAEVALGAAGLLPDPNHELGKALAGGAHRLDALEKPKPAVLLGESGMGKSSTVAEHVAARPTSARLIALRDFGTDTRLKDAIDRALTQLPVDVGAELVLDGLDETVATPFVVFSVVADALTTRRDVALRITSRTGFWHRALADDLERKLGTQLLPIELLPLREADVRTIATTNGVDANALVQSLRDKGLTALAARPLTLRLIVEEMRATGVVPGSRSEIFERGMRRLASGTDHEDAGLRYKAAQRIALTMKLTHRPVIAVAQRDGGTHEEVLTLGEIDAGKTDGVDEKVTRAVLQKSGVFSARGPARLGFAHDSFGDFLAGTALADSKLSARDVLRCLTSDVDGDQTLVPALTEVAGWAASRSDVARALMKIEPKAALSGDPSLLNDVEQREHLTRLFAALKDGRVGRHEIDRGGLSGFRASAVGALALSRAQSGTPPERDAAVQVLAALGPPAAPALRKVAFKRAFPIALRVQAARALRKIGDSRDRAAFRKLALSPKKDDKDDELKGVALRALWPNHITLAELLPALTDPKSPSFFGSYSSFLSSFPLPEQLSDADWHLIIGWLNTSRAHRRHDATSGIIERLAQKLLAGAPGAAQISALGTLYARACPIYADEIAENVPTELPDALQPARLDIAEATFRAARKPEDAAYQLLRVRPHLFHADDFSACVARASATSAGPVQDAWCRLAIYVRRDVDLDALIEARQKLPKLRELSRWLDTVDIDSEAAQGMRNTLKLQEEAPSPNGKQSGWGAANDAAVQAELARIEAGEIDRWLHLSIELSSDGPRARANRFLDMNSPEFPGWAASDAPTRARVVTAAIRYLEAGTVSDVAIIRQGSITFGASAAVRAGVLLADQQRLAEVTVGGIRRWAANIVALMRWCSDAGGDAVRRFVARAFADAPDIAVPMLAETLRPDANKNEAIQHVLDAIEDVPTDTLEAVLVNGLDDPALKTDAKLHLLDWLLFRGIASGFERAIALAMDNTDELLSVSAARLLARHAPAEAFPFQLVREHGEAWAFAFFGALDDWRQDLTEVFTRVDTTELLKLFPWIVEHVPPQTDPEFDEAHEVTRREAAASVRDAVLAVLASRPDVAVIRAFRRLRTGKPPRPWLAPYERRAREVTALNAWTPMKPKEVAKLIDEGTVARRPGEKLARLKVPILRRCVVLCARPVEMNAIVKHLTKRAVHKTRVGAQLERGVFVGANEKWDVFVGETGQGNPAAAAYGTAAVMELRPDLFLFIGVAGGLKDVELGDIVVASEVFGYERGKVVKGGIKPRPTIARAPFRLAELAREIARSTDWHARLSKANKPGRKRGGAAVYVEPIVAGEKIVADNRSAVAAFLRKHFSHAYAVEMEAAGFSEAAHVTEARALIVRGISDLIDEKESSDAAGWQGVASARAAAFGFHLLSELDQKPRSSSKRASAKRKQ